MAPAEAISRQHGVHKGDKMKDHLKLLVTGLLSVGTSVVLFAVGIGVHREKVDNLVRETRDLKELRIQVAAHDRQINVNTDHIKAMEVEGTKALQSHMADNSREGKDFERRMSHVEIIVESLSDLKADVREIKVRLGDVQERQKRMEDLKSNGIK